MRRRSPERRGTKRSNARLENRLRDTHYVVESHPLRHTLRRYTSFMADPPAQQPAGAVPRPRETSLLRWVWRSYVRNALVPLLVVELLLVAVYLTRHAWSLRKNVTALSEVARQELSRIAKTNRPSSNSSWVRCVARPMIASADDAALTAPCRQP